MNRYAIEIKWAAIFVVMLLLWMVGEKLGGLYDSYIHLHPIVTNFVAIPAITVYVLALLDKKKNFFDGTMTYGQGFLSGIVLTLIVTLVSPATQYLVNAVIAPEYFPNVIAYSVSEGKMTQEAAEAYFNMQSYVVQALIGTPVMGLLTTAIVAIFTRSKKS